MKKVYIVEESYTEQYRETSVVNYVFADKEKAYKKAIQLAKKFLEKHGNDEKAEVYYRDYFINVYPFSRHSCYNAEIKVRELEML